MFPEKNIALLKIQTQTGQTFVTVQTFMPLDKRINARPFRDPQLLHSPIFLSPSLPVSLFSPRARKSQRRPWVHASKRTRVRARTTLFPPSPSSLLLLNNHRTSRGRDLSYIIPYDSSAPLFVPSFPPPPRDSPSSRGSFMEPLKSTTIRMEGREARRNL